PLGQTGHQRFGWIYTTKDFTVLEPDSRVQLPFDFRARRLLSRQLVPRWPRAVRIGDRVSSITNPDTRPDNWAAYYNFDQYLYTKPDDAEQGFGLFGRFGFAPTTGNIFEQFYSLGLGGKGLVPHRAHDTWGAGYYLTNVSDDLGSL